jgi:hypothetical protein
MLDVLHRVESLLPALVTDRVGWSSKLIDYTPPVVWRLYRDLAVDGVTYRVYLHRIFACEEAFYHPHPWPSAIRVLPMPNAVYEMGVGYGTGAPPPLAATLRVRDGFEYEMVDRGGWHYVKVVGAPSVSVMVTGPVWDGAVAAPRTASYPFRELTGAEALEVFLPVERHYLR